MLAKTHHTLALTCRTCTVKICFWKWRLAARRFLVHFELKMTLSRKILWRRSRRDSNAPAI